MGRCTNISTSNHHESNGYKTKSNADPLPQRNDLVKCGRAEDDKDGLTSNAPKYSRNRNVLICTLYGLEPGENHYIVGKHG